MQRPAIVRRSSKHGWWTARRNVWLWWLLAVCGGTSTAVAQYRFDAWTTSNGMPNNSIWALCQTRDGYLWITTSSGLVRFDGVRLTVFDKSNSPDITGNRFSVLHEDRAGNLWIGTEDGGVLRYRAGVFTSWTVKEGLPGNRVDRIDEDSSGVIWVFTDKGLAQWQNGRLTKVEPFLGTTLKNLVTSKEENFDRYRTGLWQRSANAWQVFRNGAWMPLPLPAPATGQAFQALRYASVDTRGRLWYGLPGQPEEHYCVDEGRLKIFRTSPDQRSAFYQDRQERLWTSDKTDHISLWKDGKAVRLPRQWLNWNYSVLEDREGNIWLGTYDTGLLRMIEQVVSFLQLPGGPRERYVYPLLEDRAGQVWISAGEAGLLRYADGRFTHFPLAGATSHVDLSALYQDRDDSIWAGTYKYGIARLRDGVFRTDQTLSAQIKGRVDIIHRDRLGDLWFGGQAGLHRLSGAGQLKHYGLAEGLASSHVKTLLEDSAGRLWLGGYGGISLWQGGKFKNWTKADGMVSNRVIYLHEDKDGSVWAGTYDGGLYRLRESTAGWRLTRYTTREGLFTNQVNQILEDEQGFFWIGSARGIYRLRKQELDDFAEGRVSSISSTSFGKEDGLLNIDCIGGFQPAGFRARDGRLWFPTQDGIAVIDPRRIPFNQTPPPVVIEECLLDRQPADQGGGLTIRPGQSDLEIHYTGLSLAKSEQVRFKYKLEGLDHNWVEVGTRRTAYYSHVPPGSYTFKVTAANSDGVWNSAGQSLRIRVLPPFYRTWWFLGLTALLGGAAVWLSVHLRLRQVHQQHAQQQAFSRRLIESQEGERKRIAAELHDSLTQSLVIIKNRALLGLQTPDEAPRLTTQLEEIAESAIFVIDEVKEIAYALRPFHLDRLGLTTALEEMLERVAESSGLQLTTRLERIDGLFTPEGEINLYRIVQECVNNAVKHARATELQVTITRTARDVKLLIADNGCGFDPNGASHNGKQHGGFGLHGIAERARIMGGLLTIRSAPGQGVTVTLKLTSPLSES
jgi:signal transduction histidine kinase/ligand-binding sensor domain-containing protein